MGFGSEIRNKPFPYPGSGSRGQKGTESRIRVQGSKRLRIRNTGIYVCSSLRHLGSSLSFASRLAEMTAPVQNLHFFTTRHSLEETREDQAFSPSYDLASPLSKLSLLLSLPICRRSSLLTGRGWDRSQITREKAWSVINHSILSDTNFPHHGERIYNICR
jgi:hypothetical protein